MARTPSDLLRGPPTRCWAAGCWVLLSASALPACATSHRIVHHRRAYFEHCHAADYDASRSSDERTQCWNAWLAHHSDGDAPERIQYAQKRLRSLERDGGLDDENPPPLPGLHPSAAASYVTFTALPSGGSAAESVASGETASPETPPQREPLASTHDRPDLPTLRGDAGSPRHRQDGHLSEPCSPVCDPLLDSCIEACTGYGGDCRNACRVEERLCLRACR